MKMVLDDSAGRYTVRSYSAGEVQIREQRFVRSLIVLPGRILPDWEPGHPRELSSTHLGPVIEHAPEVLILGTGERQVFPEPALFAELMSRGIGFEVMDNAAACRTYNILVAEGREAALALVITNRPD
jgi:uncharacterized protein